MGDVTTSDRESAGISLTGVDVASGVTGGVADSEQTETSNVSIFCFLGPPTLFDRSSSSFLSYNLRAHRTFTDRYVTVISYP